MKFQATKSRRRGTILLMIVGLLAMLFVIVSAYIVLARFDRQALGYVRQGNQVTQVLGSVHDVLSAEVRGPRTTPGGSVTGAAYVETPAYYDGDPNLPTTKVQGAPWLASPEPVRDPTLPVNDPNSWIPGTYEYPVVTGVSGKVSGKRSLTGLMWNAFDQTAGERVNVRPGDPRFPANLTPDTVANARDVFTDADGDGIPDSYFGAVSVLTELANAMVGQSLQAGHITPDTLNWLAVPPGADVLAWMQFSELARYAVAAKIVSHGGMVQVSAPTNAIRWNSEFLGGMFNWVKLPRDSGWLLPRKYLTDRTQLFNMWAQRGAVEPFLRRRGGLLAGWEEDENQPKPERVPPAMWRLQDRFPYTFHPLYGTLKDDWQRFNLASLNEWNAWRQAATIDPVIYNYWYRNGGTEPRYVMRQLLTTANHSDELAREQGQWIDPAVQENSLVFSRSYWNYPPSQPPPLGLWPGIEPGSLKYYLGWIRSAFDPSANFVTNNNAAYDGYEVIRDLVSYFSEMLAGHKDFPDLDPSAGDNVERLQQAYMLAVNTVAFAAPRGANGHVDAVYASDPTGNLYIGYAPQPFITQVVAYNDPEDPNDPNSPPRIALAIELYNPHDSDASGVGSDKHALDLSRFAISINDNFNHINVAGRLDRLGAPWRLPGRTFLLCAAHVTAAANTYFEDQNTAGNLPSLRKPVFTGPEFLVSYASAGDPIKVRLWRHGNSRLWDSLAGWYLVDEMEVDTRVANPGAEWYVNVRRDCTWEPYLGAWQGNGPRARWRMTVAFDPNDPYPYYTGPLVPGTPDQALLNQLGGPFDSNGNDPGAHENALGLFGPSVPLHMMNAGAKPWPDSGVGFATVHGTKRPESFPTVGFMLFVPRLSHIVTSGAERKPMSRLLRDLWDDRGYSFPPAVGPLPPADFGHMPIFDNTQEVQSGAKKVVGQFDDTGRVPWGLLVFDYFTTLDPDDANGDGNPNPNVTDPLDTYRVDGRININTAPWYVLAGLPLLGPGQNGDLTVSKNGAAAFWSTKSGGLVGTAADPNNPASRYPLGLVNSASANNGQWYRLGPYLAQAATAYRDRVQYADNVTGSPPPLKDAFWRSNPLVAGYRPTRYGDPNEPIVRGAADNVLSNDPNVIAQWKRGFLTVGELANVMGFDSSILTAADTWASLPAGGDYNPVLGPYNPERPYNPALAVELGGDFMKAVSLLALLDTHFLTTRSNTFTVYLTLTDRKDPQASVRSQVTIDRSNLLPRLLEYDRDNNGIPDTFITQEDSGLPETVGQREVSYFNARYDE